MTSRWWFYPSLVVLVLPLLPILLLVFASIITYPTLPSLETLTDYRPKMPLKVFSAEGTLIGEFGEKSHPRS
jgi:penicillin-binding protein 1A